MTDEDSPHRGDDGPDSMITAFRFVRASLDGSRFAIPASGSTLVPPEVMSLLNAMTRVAAAVLTQCAEPDGDPETPEANRKAIAYVDGMIGTYTFQALGNDAAS